MIVFEADDVVVPAGESGMHTFMYRGEGVATLARAVDREGVAGKIHHQPLRDDERLDDYLWGMHYLPAGERSRLVEAVAIQNICAIHDLAPRVYGLALWRDEYGQLRPVQITDDLGRCDWGQPKADVYAVHDNLKALGEALGFQVPGRDKGVQNVVAGKWVDFGGYQYGPDFEAGLLERYWEGVQWGDRPYQQIPGGGAREACRDTDARYRDFGLDAPLDFTPRHILDVGCNGGQFLNLLTWQHKARGTGYDTARAVTGAREYSAWAGAWNVDYHAADLRQPDAVIGNYDLVLFLSMSRHVGLPDYVKRVAAKRLIVEVHHEHEAECRAWLDGDFRIVREQTSADYGRLVLHAERVRGDA